MSLIIDEIMECISVEICMKKKLKNVIVIVNIFTNNMECNIVSGILLITCLSLRFMIVFVGGTWSIMKFSTREKGVRNIYLHLKMI